MLETLVIRQKRLSKPQVRILRFLDSIDGWATETTINQEARIEPAWLSRYLYGNIGDWNDKPVKETTPRGIEREKETNYSSLLTLRMVEAKPYRGDGNLERVWTITELGKQAFKEYMDAHNAKRQKKLNKVEEEVDIE